MIDQECRTCMYWDIPSSENANGDELHPDDNYADCRRFPPVRWASKQQEKTMHWPADAFEFPTTSGCMWCGEYKGKPLAQHPTDHSG